ncbi:MAG TPA: hypothetical protein VNM48_02595 [Chloroflexota bacterium]|nr:hypothetical protein [Chloroflexota bacterium]
MSFDAKFEPRDLWVGVFWDRRKSGDTWQWHVYVCPVPMFVLHWSLECEK